MSEKFENVAPCENLGAALVFEEIALERLFVDPDYQRRIANNGEKKIRKIIREFNWRAFGALLVSGPDNAGDYAIVDGQHRFEAAKVHPAVTVVPCLVLPPSGSAQEADTFLRVNADKVNVTGIAKFHARLVRGDDAARQVKDVCDAAGVVISRAGTGRQKPLHTVAVAAIGRCLKDYGRPAVLDALETMVAGQAECENAFRSQAIKAVVRFFARHGAAVDRARLVAVLEDLDFDHEIGNARTVKNTLGGGTDEILEQVIANRYNKGLKASRLTGAGR